MFRRAALALSLGFISLTTACSDSSSPVAPAAEPAARAFLIGGDYQSITASTSAGDTLTVRFVSASGAPVAGAAVKWTTDGAGDVTPLATTTASDGTARALYRAGTKAGEYEVAVASGSINAQFHLKITAAAAKRLQSMIAEVDTVEFGDAFSGAPVRLTDEFGNAAAGGLVNVAIFSGDDAEAAANLTLSANGQGVASVSDMPLSAGTYRIVYTLGSATVSYTVIVMGEPDPIDP